MNLGDTVYVVYGATYHGSNAAFVITKIGSKWVECARQDRPLCTERFRKDTWVLDSGGYPAKGRAYASKATWEAELELADAWKAFAADVRSKYFHPDGVTVANICQARKLLFQENV